MTIGERIKEQRIKAGLTQKQLGERIGVSGSAIGQFEKKDSMPNSKTLKKISEALNIPPSYLWGDFKTVKEAEEYDIYTGGLIGLESMLKNIFDEIHESEIEFEDGDTEYIYFLGRDKGWFVPLEFLNFIQESMSSLMELSVTGFNATSDIRDYIRRLEKKHGKRTKVDGKEISTTSDDAAQDEEPL